MKVLMAVFVTGDMHGDCKRLTSYNFPQGEKLTRDDVLVVTGDFGMIFENTQTTREIYLQSWFSTKRYTIVFIDGNHDNHTRLRKLPKVEKFGSYVGKVSENVFYLQRGYVYTIQGKKFFTMGGALSRDIVLFGEVEWSKISHFEFRKIKLKDVPEAFLLCCGDAIV